MKAVPPGATVVGIPARVVDDSLTQRDAARMAFSAYAVTDDEDDPLNKVLSNLGQRADATAGQVEALLARLEELEKKLEDSSGSAHSGIKVVSGSKF